MRLGHKRLATDHLTASPLNFGRSWRIRTADQRIKSPLLYQLS